MENSADLNGKFLGTITSDFVKVFEKYFGHFVVLETNNPELLKYMQK